MQSSREKILFAGEINVKVVLDNGNKDHGWLCFQERATTETKHSISKPFAEILMEASSLTIPFFCLLLFHSNQSSKAIADIKYWREKLLANHIKTLQQSLNSLIQKPSANSVTIHKDQTDLINELPVEILLMIFKEITLTSVKNTMLVCRKWHLFMRDNSSWRERFASLPYADEEEIAINKTDEPYYLQFFNLLKKQLKYAPRVKGLIKPAIYGDFISLLTEYNLLEAESKKSHDMRPGEEKNAETETISITAIHNFNAWLYSKEGEAIFSTLCILKHQPILDLLFEIKLCRMNEQPSIYPIKQLREKIVRYNQIDKLVLSTKFEEKVSASLLDEAARWNHLDALAKLLEMLEIESATPLAIACSRGHIQALKIMLDSLLKKEIAADNMEKIKVLCQFYMHHNQPKSIFKTPPEIGICGKILKLIEEKNLTFQTFSGCSEMRDVRPLKINLFSSMLNIIEELLKEKKETQKIEHYPLFS